MSLHGESTAVSFEDHLADALYPLRPLLPDPVSGQLSDLLHPPPQRGPSVPNAPAQPPRSTPADAPSRARTIPYALLSSISKWTRTPEGAQALARHDPPLHAADYTIVALLAGTRTEPDRRFPDVPVPHAGPSPDAYSTTRRDASDRRAVTAVLNALLSIAGAGVATWWAADRLAWKNEWKVLLALSVAIVVASSEAILYLIWDSRRTKPTRSRALRMRARMPAEPGSSLQDKKSEDPQEEEDAASPSRSSGVPRTSADKVAKSSAHSTHAPGTQGHSLRERLPARTDEHGAHRQRAQ